MAYTKGYLRQIADFKGNPKIPLLYLWLDENGQYPAAPPTNPLACVRCRRSGMPSWSWRPWRGPGTMSSA